MVQFFWSLNFHHSSLIIQFSSLITLNTNVVWYHHSVFITHYFSHYLGAPRLSRCSFFFFFFFFPSSQQPEPSEKKKKTVKKTEPSEGERKKKKKNQWRRPNQWERRRKKKSQLVKSCGWVGPSCVFNYKNAIELWVMKTKNNQKVFSVSITHNSKIRELSDGNKKLKTEL